MTELYRPRPDRLFRFSLRSFLLLMLVIAGAFGWTMYKVRQQSVAVAALRQMGCSFYYPNADSRPQTVLERLRKLLGEDESRNVTGVIGHFSRITDAGMMHCRGLPQVNSLGLGYTQITDAGLVHLRGQSQLHNLYLQGTQVSDAGLAHLRGLYQLRWLDLEGTQVTDDGVQRLQKALPQCKIIAKSKPRSKAA